MLQKKSIETTTFELLKKLMTEPILSQTRLVGGTALALQLGHRKSTDLDLFTNEQPDIEFISNTLTENYGYIPVFQSRNTTIGTIDGVKIDVIYHPYKWLNPVVVEESIRLASIEDIAAMKLHAIANSGERPKDFVDIVFIGKRYSFNQMKEFGIQKYPVYNPLMFDKSIIYFDDINQEAISNIKMNGYDMDWEKIKQRIVKMTEKPDKVFLNPPLQRVLATKTQSKLKLKI